MKPAAGNGDRTQLSGPGHRYFGFYPGQGARIVPLLEVDGLDEASAELVRGGAELLGGPESDGARTWLTFRAPEGNIHSQGRPAWRSCQVTKLRSNSLDMRQKRRPPPW